jgi:hypothetical protein
MRTAGIIVADSPADMGKVLVQAAKHSPTPV